MIYRTDLAMEAEPLRSSPGNLPGVKVHQEMHHGLQATVVEITGKEGEKALGKPRGRYITVDLSDVLSRERESFSRAVQCLSEYLRDQLSLPASLPVLVAGLGNRDVTPDAIGPLTTDHILVTRHMMRAMPEVFGLFRPVSAVIPGVLGTTGVESAETVRAVARQAEAAAVIAVDAIAAREPKRLCASVQISNTGITPGSGIGNSRCALDKSTLGVPVISVGVPTVTDAATLAADLLKEAACEPDENALQNTAGKMIVTVGDIDKRVREVSRVLAYAINSALQPELDLDDLSDLTF